MTARYDKVIPEVSVTRAALNAPLDVSNYGKIVGVGINANGRAVMGPGNTGIIGVWTPNRKFNAAGSIIDVLSLGDIVDDAANLPAGTVFAVNDTTGVVSALAGANPTIPAGSSYVGHTVEAGRLVVRFDRKAGA